MNVLLEVLLVMAGLALLIGLRAPRLFATLLVGLYLLQATLLQYLPPALLLCGWLVFLPVALFLHHAELRRRWVSAPFMQLFGTLLPPLSRTEREALEAGTLWWETDLFSGQPDWNALLDIPPPRLSEEEQAFLDGPVEALCAMVDDWDITERRRDLPPEVWRFMGEQGFFGMIIPKEYDGLAFSAHAHSTVVMKLATRSISAAVTVMVPNSLGPAELLLRYGTDAQCQHYLPRLARGVEIPCFALTAPEAGSDAAAMTDRGVVCHGSFEGRDDVLGIRLNWEKRYITLGPVATVLGLAFKLFDPERLLGEEESLGITLALIPTDTPGVEIGRRHFPLDIAFQNGPNRGVDVFIPLDWIIGGRAQIGQGWRMLMECLAAGRAISLPALSTGAGKLTAFTAGSYAAIRKQFKVPIGQFEGIQEALARIATNAYLMDAARGLTTVAVDRGERPAVASAIVKYHLTERMRASVDDAMDIHGGRGICMGPRNYLARVYQAIPISITVEGANILTRNLIIFGQGAVRCHPFLRAEIDAAARGDLVAFDTAMLQHLGLTLSNGVRAVFHGLTGSLFARSPGGRCGRYFRDFSRMSAAFAVTAEVALLLLGGNLKRREAISARLGDVLSYLYLGSAVLKRFHEDGYPAEDWPLVQWNCEQLRYDMQRQLMAVCDNLPMRPLALLLRHLLFPWGASLVPPRDRLTHRVATRIQQAGASRDRLLQGLYRPRAEHEPLAQLERALRDATAAEPALKKIRIAMRKGDLAGGDPELRVGEALAAGIIDDGDAEHIRAAMESRYRAIQVDDFPATELTREQAPWPHPAHERSM
jgi:acyl-CoA dehydrogenase